MCCSWPRQNTVLHYLNELCFLPLIHSFSSWFWRQWYWKKTQLGVMFASHTNFPESSPKYKPSHMTLINTLLINNPLNLWKVLLLSYVFFVFCTCFSGIDYVCLVYWVQPSWLKSVCWSPDTLLVYRLWFALLGLSASFNKTLLLHPNPVLAWHLEPKEPLILVNWLTGRTHHQTWISFCSYQVLHTN